MRVLPRPFCGAGRTASARGNLPFVTSTEADLARVTVVSANRRIDLALPGSSTLGELLPGIVQFAGHEAGPAAEAVQTWVVQRLGEDPLDANRRVSQLSIRDGDTLHLLRRAQSMPEAAFDDVVDAVATATKTRANWRPVHSQRLALGAIVGILVGVPLLLLRIDPSALTAAASLAVASMAGLAAILLARAAGKPAVAGALAWSAIAVAGLAGWHLLPGGAPLPTLLTASLVLLFAAVMAVGTYLQIYRYATVCFAALLVLVVSLVAALLPGRIVEVFAVGLVVILGATPLLPGLSLRMARVAMPNLPSDPSLLASDDQQIQSDIIARAVAADRLLATLLSATATAVAVCAIPLIRTPSIWAPLVVLAAGLALLLRSRAFVGFAQRMSQLLGGLALCVLVAFRAATEAEGTIRLLIGVAVVVVAVAILAWYAAALYNKIVAPTWGRVGDIVEWLALLAMVPLLFAVLDLYSRARGLLPG